MNKTVLKARYGTELRKNWIHHNNDMSLNDLVTKMQRYFDIADIAASALKLKYRDEGFFKSNLSNIELLT